MQEALQVRFPHTDIEVKIMLPSALHGGLLQGCDGRVWMLLGESSKRQAGSQAADQQASPNTVECVHHGFLQNIWPFLHRVRRRQ
jgi:hypothetical protein